MKPGKRFKPLCTKWFLCFGKIKLFDGWFFVSTKGRMGWLLFFEFEEVDKTLLILFCEFCCNSDSWKNSAHFNILYTISESRKKAPYQQNT